MEVPTDSHQDAGQGKKVEAPQGKDNNQEKGKGKASDTAPSQSEQVADPQAPKTKTWDISFSIAFVFFVYCFRIYFFFLKTCTLFSLLMKIHSFCLTCYVK